MNRLSLVSLIAGAALALSHLGHAQEGAATPPSADPVAAPTAAPAPAPVSAFKGKMVFQSKTPLEQVDGTAEGKGELAINPADLTQMSGSITVPVDTMLTGNARRDKHLRGADWLDAAQFPNITFKLGKVDVVQQSKTGEVQSANLTVSGDFTLHGVTKPLKTEATMKWKGTKAKITTKFKVALADFAVVGAQGVVGSKVSGSIDVEVTLLGAIK